jgi:Ca2+-transporting ATPase
MKNWYSLEIPEVVAELKGNDGNGLEKDEAARRLREYGPNALQAGRVISPWAILLSQFKNVLILILVIAVILSAFLGHGIEAIAISVIVLFAILLGFIQEYRAERAMEALKKNGRADGCRDKKRGRNGNTGARSCSGRHYPHQGGRQNPR